MPQSSDWEEVIRPALEAPFHSTEVAWRALLSGIADKGQPWVQVAPYVTARAVQRRLDDVIGGPAWRASYSRWGDHGVICVLEIRIDGEWIGKEDGAADTRGRSSGDVDEQLAVKGGLSQAMKRAAVQWGIGRYLYDLPMPMFADTDKRYRRGWTKGWIWEDRHSKKGCAIWWKPPQLPRWALPDTETRPPEAESAVNRVKLILFKEVGCANADDAEVCLRHLNPEWGLAELNDVLQRDADDRNTFATQVLATLETAREQGKLSDLLPEARDSQGAF